MLLSGKNRSLKIAFWLLNAGPGERLLHGRNRAELVLSDNYTSSPNATVTFNELTPTQAALADELMGYIVSFVRSGSPNTHKLARSPDWPSHRGSRVRLVIGPSQQEDPITSGCHQESIHPEERALYEGFWLGKVEQTQN